MVRGADFAERGRTHELEKAQAGFAVKSYALTGKYNRRLEDAIDENASANVDMECRLLPLMLAQNLMAKLLDVGVVALSLALYTSGRMARLNCVMLSICSFLRTEGLEQAGTQSSLLRAVDTCANQADDILRLPAMDTSGSKFARSSMTSGRRIFTFPTVKSPSSTVLLWTFPNGQPQRLSDPPAAAKRRCASCCLASGMWTQAA